ncbi:MAG: efflux RND transporter permease subunit [Roseiflexus sp.]|nr:efflux RND transporter permease subunit [Roseiflexus sp.]MCS7287569.1 efflux RND transporter permease subunit [Roseiflexus sp.]MDW8232555.1 efflux RND transporter permease subunit [Roseiflexaceae bacterium]
MATRRREEELNGMPISDTSIRQPVFVTMLMLLTVVFGILSFRSLPVNLLPDVEVPIIAVSVPYPGASPESVAEQVAKPIEDAVNTIEGIENITTSASEGLALIVLEFAQGTDVNRADQDVREKVNAIRPTLPRDVREPIFQKFDPNAAPIISFAIAGTQNQSPLEVRRIVDNEIAPLIQRAQGVGSVRVSGGLQRQINVLMDLEKLRAYGILPVQITRALQQANANLGLGSITTGAQEINLRAPSLLQTPEDIARIQITGTPYRIGDVATVEDGIAEQRSYTRLNGVEAIIIDVLKQSGANTVIVADNAKAALERALANRNDLTYVIPRDASEAVRQSTISSLEELIYASVAALLVVMLFFSGLRNMLITAAVPAAIALVGLVILPAIGVPVDKVMVLAIAIGLLVVLTFIRDRNTLVTMAGLPIILMGTFAFMPVFGLSINLVTLLALALCVGLVIDDAIVVRENIFRHTQRGESPRIAASRGTAEVALSVVAMTLTVVAVFVPVTFTTGTTGIIFKSFGITIAIAILLSMVEAFMFAPMLSANLFRRQKVQPHPRDEAHSHAGDIGRAARRLRNIDPNQADAGLLHEAEEDPGPLGRFYERVLSWSLRSLRNRLIVIATAVVVLLLSVVVASGLKFSFFPQQDAGEFLVGFELPPGTALAETDRLARQAEQVILADPDVESVISTVGFADALERSSERAEFFVRLKEDVPTRLVEERLRPQLAFLPNLTFGLPSIGVPTTTRVTGRQLQLSLQTTGPVQELAPVIEQIKAEMAAIPGVVDIDSSYRPGRPELRFIADPERIGDLGITNEEIAASVRALVNGDRATVLRQAGQDIDIVVRLRPEDRATPEALQNIAIPTRSGTVPLSALGRIELASTPQTIRRLDKLNQVIIGANLQGRNLGEVQNELQQRLEAKGIIPPTVIASFTGLAQQQNEGFGSLLLAMLLSVIFVYMVLASQFGSFTQPLVIMMAMPFSFIGAFLGLRLINVDLDITGMIGLIMLLGLVVKNSILLVDFTNRLRRAGLDKHAALELAGAIRLRPILMTTLSLVAGALPVAMGIHLVGTGEGGEFRKGLATVLIGGLMTSMLLTLLVVPTAYSLMDSFTERVSNWFRRRFDPEGWAEEQAAREAELASVNGDVPAVALTLANGGMTSEPLNQVRAEQRFDGHAPIEAPGKVVE